MVLFGSSFGLFYASKCFFADMRGTDDITTTTLAAIPTGLFIGGYGLSFLCVLWFCYLWPFVGGCV